MIRKFRLVWFLCAVLLLLAGCAESEPVDTTAVPVETTLAPTLQTEPVETTLPVVDEPVVVVNNGGLAVRCGEILYYWGLAENGGFCLLREQPDGAAVELTVCSEQTGIYVLGKHVYVNGDDGILCIHSEDRTVQSIGTGKIVGADEGTGKLILLEDGYWTIDNSSGERNAISVAGNYIRTCDGRVFFSETSEDLYSASLWMYELDTGVISCISSSTASFMSGAEPGWGYSGCEIVNIQVLGDVVYYSYGYFGGSGLYFQPYGGGLVRVDLTDGSSQLLDDIGDTPDYRGPVFRVYDQDGAEYVRYYDTEYSQYTLHVNSGEKTVTEGPLGLANEPFPVSGEGYWRVEESGEAVQILPDVTANGPEGEYLHCRNVSDVGSFVFYELVYEKENPNASSWWDYTIQYKQEAWRYNAETGESTLLWTKDLT